MPVQAALGFLRAARRDEALAHAVDALGYDVTLDALAGLATRAGYPCTPEELERAHALDCGLRWARHQA